MKRMEDADWAVVLANSFCSSRLQRARRSVSWGHCEDGCDCKDKTGYNYYLIIIADTKIILATYRAIGDSLESANVSENESDSPEM